MINTLNVITQGHLPNLTSLTVVTLGWLGGELSVFIENNEFVWILNEQNYSWSLINKDEIWLLNKQDINWTTALQTENWTISIQNIKWTIQDESD